MKIPTCTEVKISPMVVEDVPAVMEIEQHSQIEPWNAESFLEELGKVHSHCFTARGGASGILGYICFWIVLDEIQILNIAVHKSFRRQGIGRALMLHCLGWGAERGARSAGLEVRESNLPARKLYEELGFKVVGERPGYYGKVRESAILMELQMDYDWRHAHLLGERVIN